MIQRNWLQLVDKFLIKYNIIEYEWLLCLHACIIVLRLCCQLWHNSMKWWLSLPHKLKGAKESLLWACGFYFLWLQDTTERML